MDGTRSGARTRFTEPGVQDVENENVYSLVKALTDFIQSLVQGEGLGRPQTEHTYTGIVHSTQSGDNLTREASQLIDALQAFVASLYRDKTKGGTNIQNKQLFDLIDKVADEIPQSLPSINGKTDKEATDVMVVSQRPCERAGLKPDSCNIYSSSISVSSSLSIANSIEQQEMVESALSHARQLVFNKLPVRMLMFDKKGENIRLVERADIYHQISTEIRNELQAPNTSYLRRMYDYSYQNWILNFVRSYTHYAILSHTWSQGAHEEITYQDWNANRYEPCSPAYAKLATFCRVAATEYDMALAWVDSMCINKDSSSELDESIRSMYRWYQDSTVCIAYLSGTTAMENMHADKWFTRGWTLQELVAPHRIKFYARDWTALGKPDRKIESDKKNEEVLEQITQATSITGEELSKFTADIPISRRMQWAAKRQVTREEDIAYSLMGIFDVNIATAYGEGAESAFVRLVREILSSCDRFEYVLDITNWGSGPHLCSPWIKKRSSYLIPPSPEAYLFRTTCDIKWYYTQTPTTLTRVGLSVSVLLMPTWNDGLELNAKGENLVPQGSFYGSISTHKILDFRSFDQLAMKNNPGEVIAFDTQPTVMAVLNFDEKQTVITIPRKHACFAIMLEFHDGNITLSNRFGRTGTDRPVTFQLKTTQVRGNYTIPKADLHRHGIALRTMYL